MGGPPLPPYPQFPVPATVLILCEEALTSRITLLAVSAINRLPLPSTRSHGGVELGHRGGISIAAVAAAKGIVPRDVEITGIARFRFTARTTLLPVSAT